MKKQSLVPWPSELLDDDEYTREEIQKNREKRHKRREKIEKLKKEIKK